MISYERALPILMVYGVYEGQAQELAGRYSLREIVRAMVKGRGKRNPAGYVIWCLVRGASLNPMTDEEYARELSGFQAEAAARPAAWRRAVR